MTKSALDLSATNNTVAFDNTGIANKLANLAEPCFAVQNSDQLGISNSA